MTVDKEGARVKAHGLVGAAHLNGQVGTVESAVGDRVQVRFDGSVEVKALKRSNLSLVVPGVVESAKTFAKVYWTKAEAMMPTPFGLSKRQVLSIGVGLLAVLLATTLFGGRGQPVYAAPASSGAASRARRSGSGAFESSAEYARVQSAYKAGYDAAEGGLEFGANLQPLLDDAKSAMASGASSRSGSGRSSATSDDGFDDEEEDDDDFAMPSPPLRPASRGGPTMGMLGMIGPIILGKQIFDLGRCPGIPIGSPGFWDWRLCIAQLKNLSGMRKGFMALMVLRILGMSPI